MYSSSDARILICRRPKPHRSLKPGCAPTLQPASFARVTKRCITVGSPAWKPQATFAERMILTSAASLPME